MSTSTDTVIYEPAVIEVSNEVSSIDASVGTPVDIVPCSSIEVPVSKKEYTIVSDGLYIPENTDTPPSWVTEAVNNAINPYIKYYLADMVATNGNLLNALDSLDIANNAYQEMVHIDTRIDQAIAIHLTTLNSRLDTNDASIINLNTTKATPQEASAIAIRTITSSLNDGSPNSIGGRFASIGSSISTLAGNVTGTTDLLESRYGELNEAITELTVEVGASENRVYSTFLYDSILKIGGESFRTGFGLDAEAKIPVPGQPGVFTSEFWIDAQRLKFTNSNRTGSISPFTIDASGAVPQISFNGVVTYSNITGPDKPEAGATRNENRGAWGFSQSYLKGDIVTDNGNSWTSLMLHTSSGTNRPPSLSTTVSSTWRLLSAKGVSTHIRYSANSNGSTFTTAPQSNSLFIGVATSEVAPVTAAGYAWSRYRGNDGANGTNGTNGSNGAASTVVYRRATSASVPSAGWSNPPSNWYSSVPSGSLPLWECTGSHTGNGWWIWEHPRVSSTYWTKPNNTYIDGNKIFTGDAYVDTLQIKGRAVTVNEYAVTTLIETISAANGWRTFITKQITHPGFTAGGTSVICLVLISGMGVGGSNIIEMRVIRSDGTVVEHGSFSAIENYAFAYSLFAFDASPTVNPSYRIQFKPTTGSVQISGPRAVFISGKR